MTAEYRLLHDDYKPLAQLGDPVAVDIETAGLGFHTDPIRLIALADAEQALLVAPPEDPLLRMSLSGVLGQLFQTRRILVHHATFDLSRLVYHLGLPVPERIWDTMAAEALLTAGSGAELSLAETVLRRLGQKLDKALQTSFLVTERLSSDQLQYAATDARILLELARAQGRALAEARLGPIWHLTQAVLPAFVRMVARGLPVDPERLEELSRELEERAAAHRRTVELRFGQLVEHQRLAEIEAAQEALNVWEQARKAETNRLAGEWATLRAQGVDALLAHPIVAAKLEQGEDPVRLTRLVLDEKPGNLGWSLGQQRFARWGIAIWRREHPRPPKPRSAPRPFNPDSPQQVREAFGLLGYDLESVAVEALAVAPIRPEHRSHYVEPLLAYRKAQKLLTAFGRPLPDYVGPDRAIRANIRPVGTATGRPTASEPNVLQLPRDDVFRRLVVAPPDHVLVVADYSQMELRILAQLSEDAGMIEAFQNNRDIHFETTLRMFPDEAVRTASLWAMQAGVSTDRAGAALLSRLLEAAPAGVTTPEFLQACRRVREDQAAGGGHGQGAPTGPGPSQLEVWDRSLQALPEGLLRALREHPLPPGPPPGSGPDQQRPFELRDALQVLSSARARVLEELPEWGDRRQVGKTISFLICYGGGASNLMAQVAQKGIALTLPEAREFIERWQQGFAQAWAWLERTRNQVRRTGEARTPWGRVRRFEPHLSLEERMRAGANHVIQGANADITLLAMAAVDRAVAPWGGWVALEIYDELLVVVPQERAAEATALVERTMTAAAGKLLTQVPPRVSVAVGDSWAAKGG